MTKKAKQKRNEIIFTVFNKIPTTNFDLITIKAMCEAANISVGTFYHYFKDKSEFFSQIYSLIDDYLTEELLPLLTDENEINNLIHFCVGFATYADRLGANILRSVYSSYPSFSNENEETRPFYTVPHEILRRAQEKHEISQTFDTKELTKSLIIILRGYVYDWTRHEGSYDLIEYIKKFSELFLTALKK